MYSFANVSFLFPHFHIIPVYLVSSLSLKQISSSHTLTIYFPLVIVTCHGSDHIPKPFQSSRDTLENSSIESFCPQLPISDLSLMDIGNPVSPDYNRNIPSNSYPQQSDDTLAINSLLNTSSQNKGGKEFSSAILQEVS